MGKGTIIYIGGFELPDRNAAAHRVLNNGKILRELGYNVVFIGIDKEMGYDKDILETKKTIQGFDTWLIPYPRSSKQWIEYLSNITAYTEVISQYADVIAVICYNYQAVALMKIKKYSNRHNIKVIADCTEWYSTKGTNVFFKIIKGTDSFLRMRIIQKKLDGLIVISRYLEDYYSNCRNVICIPPLVDLLETKWDIQETDYYDKKTRLIYAGSPGRNKDRLNIVIEEIHKLDIVYNYEFYIIGINEKQYLRDFPNHKSIIKKLEKNITFLDRLTHAETLRYVKMADFTMFFRDDTRMTKAGFPTKFVESISCGTPVITTRSSDLEEYLIEGQNGYFIENKESINSVLEKVFRLSQAQIRTMKKKCYESKNFYYEQNANEVKLFLHQVMN